MNGFVVTNSHILFGEWKSVQNKYYLNNLQFLCLTKPLNKVYKSAVETNKVISTAISELSLRGNKVVVAVDDDLLVHSSISNQEEFSAQNIADLINWELTQKWGELSDYLLTFSEYETKDKSKLHSVACSKNLINGLKSIFLEKKIQTIWAGPLSSIFLNNVFNSNRYFIYNDNSVLKYFNRDKNGFDIGCVQFIDGKPNLTSDIANARIQFPKSSQSIVISEFDKQNVQKLSGLNSTTLKPFKNIILAVAIVDDNIPLKLLNTISQIIPMFSYEEMLNFFSSKKIQNNRYWQQDIGNQLDKPKLIRREKNKTQQSSKLRVKKTQRKHSVDRKHKRNISIFLFFLITLFGLLGYFLFFNPIEKEILDQATEKYGLNRTKNDSTEKLSFEQLFGHSKSILETVPNLFVELPTEKIISIKMSDGKGTIALASEETINIPNFNALNSSMKPIDCCGGIIQTVGFKIDSIPYSRTNIHAKYSEVIEYLRRYTGEVNLRKLELMKEKFSLYHPVIFRVKSKDKIVEMLAYLNSIGDNVILRKFDLTNTAGSDDHSATFYVAIYESI